jgi:hypothetical protein
VLPCRVWMSAGSDDGMVNKRENPKETWTKVCSTDFPSTINPTVIKCGQKPTIRNDRAVTDLNIGITSIYKPLIFDSQNTYSGRRIYMESYLIFGWPCIMV